MSSSQRPSARRGLWCSLETVGCAPSMVAPAAQMSARVRLANPGGSSLLRVLTVNIPGRFSSSRVVPAGLLPPHLHPHHPVSALNMAGQQVHEEQACSFSQGNPHLVQPRNHTAFCLYAGGGKCVWPALWLASLSKYLRLRTGQVHFPELCKVAVSASPSCQNLRKLFLH